MTDLRSAVAFVAVTDLDSAAEFYGATLRLTLRDERPFALVATGAGTEIRITKVDSLNAAPHTVLGWDVEDIATTIDALATRGVTFTRYDGMQQDGRGIWTSPSGARVAWFLDPDGNNLSLTQQASPDRCGKAPSQIRGATS